MFLLGAGASVEAKIPASFKLSEKIRSSFRSSPVLARHADVLDFVIGGLLFERGAAGDNPFEGVDVERLFAAVLFLSNRQRSEAGPFVGSWHGRIGEFDTVKPNTRTTTRQLVQQIKQEVLEETAKAIDPRELGHSSDIDKKLAKMLENAAKGKSTPAYDTPGKAILDTIGKAVGKWQQELRRQRFGQDSRAVRVVDSALESRRERRGQGEVFQETADAMLRQLIHIVWLRTQADVGYLTRITDVARLQGRLAVATLNYDNSMELAAEGSGCPLSTGIGEWSESSQLGNPEDGVRLLKLHGSIDWAREQGEPGPDRPLPHERLRRVNPIEELERQGSEYEPAVVFGQGNKLTARGPFLELFRAFQAELAKSDRLVVVGYSFRDDHINECIRTWLNGPRAARLVVISRSERWKETPFGAELTQFASHRLDVITEPASSGLVRVSAILNGSLA